MRNRSFGGDAVMVRRGKPPHQYTLVPVDDRAIDAIGKVPVGEVFGVRIMRERSLPQHNLFFAVLDRVGKASKFESGERLLVALKIRLGRYDLMKMPNGRVVPVPDSISFRAMPQGEFQEFMDEALRVMCEEVVPGMTPEQLLAGASAALAPHNPTPAPHDPAPESELKDRVRESLGIAP